MAQITTADKAVGDSFTHTDYNALKTAINAKPDIARRAFPLTSAVNGQAITHGFGTKLGLAVGQYHLQVAAEDASGAQLSGVTITKVTADTANLIFDDSSAVLTSCVFILTATPF